LLVSIFAYISTKGARIMIENQNHSCSSFADLFVSFF